MILTSEIKRRFAEEIINSSKDGLERLIILFSDNNENLLMSETFLGNETYCEGKITIERADLKVIGDFHTHPLLKKIKDFPEEIKILIEWNNENASEEAFISYMITKYKSIFPFSKGDIVSILVSKINRNIDHISYVCCDLDIYNVPSMRINNNLFKREKGKIIQTFEDLLRNKTFEDIDEYEFVHAFEKYLYVENIDISDEMIELIKETI